MNSIKNLKKIIQIQKRKREGDSYIRTKCIFTPYVARRLLKMGNVIVDIKPRKEDKDKTIFVFEDTEKLQADLAIAIQHYHEEST